MMMEQKEKITPLNEKETSWLKESKWARFDENEYEPIQWLGVKGYLKEDVNQARTNCEEEIIEWIKTIMSTHYDNKIRKFHSDKLIDKTKEIFNKHFGDKK